jgi:hypothetical protein
VSFASSAESTESCTSKCRSRPETSSARLTSSPAAASRNAQHRGVDERHLLEVDDEPPRASALGGFDEGLPHQPGVVDVELARQPHEHGAVLFGNLTHRLLPQEADVVAESVHSCCPLGCPDCPSGFSARDYRPLSQSEPRLASPLGR